MNQTSTNTPATPEHDTNGQPPATPPAEGARLAPARIVVAVDTSRHSLAALEEAAALAAAMHAELESLFIEDINLLHLCGFPFCSQIGSYTATVRQIDNRAMERELRVMAARVRADTARIAQRVEVPWRFHVRRGPVVAELLNAAQSALFLGLGRAGTSRRRTLGSTAQAIVARATRPVLILGEVQRTQPPLKLVYTHDAAGARGLDLALQLAPRYEHELEIWLLPPALAALAEEGDASRAESALRAELEARAPAYASAHARDLHATVVSIDTPGALLAKLQSVDHTLSGRPVHHTVILPTSQAALITYHHGPTILVP